MTTQTKPRTQIPVAYVHIDVSLDEFSNEEIIEYLRSQGESGDLLSGEGLLIAQSELDRIETLALCGQVDSARATVLSIVSAAIGRAL